MDENDLNISKAMPGADVLRSLIASRSNSSERLQQDDVALAIAAVGEVAKTSDSSNERLEATALLGKVNEAFNSNAVTAAVKSTVERALVTPLPATGKWGNAEDRFYLAKAVALSTEEWISAYAAHALAHAEIAEKNSRDLWASMAISRSKDLAASLHAVASEFEVWASEGRSPETVYRKLSQIYEALGKNLILVDAPAGSGFGRALGALIRVAGGGKGAEAMRLKEQTAISLLNLITQLLRLRLDARNDSDVYRAVGSIRNWWRPTRPPEPVERLVDGIVAMAVEVLQLLARGGVRDIELRMAVARALESARVNAIAARIAASDPTLAPDIAHWLATGKEPAAGQKSTSIDSLNEFAENEIIARVMLAMISQDAGATDLDLVASSLELFDADQAALVRRAVGRTAVLRQWVDALADRRGLRVVGTPGELVSFDPTLHEASEPVQRNANVRIVEPGIRRTDHGGSTTIISKAQVIRTS
ncbi:hypothetical protein DevBK_19595 [Devosia sp. BK]|uniref:hypothetical protein n=1 Tax=Devosia sp. BK TaxID=2871706 RepID=UPI0029397C46|nr:hypothetical protein [Devosia sp. BK]MDV3253549.1 hypothetical protein [Devosia sp. BK]